MLSLIFCHLLGDYVLQTDFIAKTKGKNLYHMFVHTFLYILPFSIVYGVNDRLFFLFISHFCIDVLKCIELIDYTKDQLFHYVVAILLYIVL